MVLSIMIPWLDSFGFLEYDCFYSGFSDLLDILGPSQTAGSAYFGVAFMLKLHGDELKVSKYCLS